MFYKLLPTPHLPPNSVSWDLVGMGCDPLFSSCSYSIVLSTALNSISIHNMTSIFKWHLSGTLAQSCLLNSRYLWTFPLWRFTGPSNSTCPYWTHLNLYSSKPPAPVSFLRQEHDLLAGCPSHQSGCHSWLLSHPNLSSQPQRATDTNISVFFLNHSLIQDAFPPPPCRPLLFSIWILQLGLIFPLVIQI